MFQRRKEWEAFSRILDQMLNGRDPHINVEYQDELPSKIRYQMVRLSEKIQGSEQQLKRERDEIRELIADIAHQMRNPLANIESYLELLGDVQCEAERQEYVEALKKTSSQLYFLTESIFQVKKAADEKEIVIDLAMDDALELSHDANWLGEAIYNMLENSVKYSPPHSVIRVSAVQNEMYTKISVSDSGIGIIEGEEEQIFQRFYRGKRTDGQPGFGLGLYLAREIVLLHGGFLKAKRNTPGLEISIFLP